MSEYPRVAAYVAAPMRKLCDLIGSDESDAHARPLDSNELNWLDEIACKSGKQNRGPAARPRKDRKRFKLATGQYCPLEAGTDMDKGGPT